MKSSLWAGPLLLALLFVALAAWTWQKWPDTLIDFGRELYVPWRIAEGDVLYRDLAYFNGPLSPYWNSLLFRCFGTSLMTLAVANLALLALLTTMLYRWLSRLFDPLTATACGGVFLLAFGFGHLKAVGNYNFVTPYSHELTHGAVLAFATLILLARPVEQRCRWRLALAGSLWGLVFLGKPEVFLAVTAATVVLALAAARQTERPLQWFVTRGSWFLAAGSIPAAAFVALLSLSMPLAEALAAVCGGWRWMLTSDVSQQTFYVEMAGLDRPWHHVLQTITATLRLALLLSGLLLMVSGRWLAGLERWLACALCIAGCLLLIESGDAFLLEERVLLAAALGLAGWSAWRLWKNRADGGSDWRLAAVLGWSVFSCLMLTKMMLAPTLYHYGFVLAMPATLLLVACSFGGSYLVRPPLGERKAVLRWQSLLLLLLLLDGALLASRTGSYMALKTHPLGEGSDRLHGYIHRAALIDEAIQRVQCEVPPEATLLAVPEGIMVNYLTRRRAPGRYTNFMPPEMEMFGEAQILESLRASPPDFVLVVHKDTDEYGFRFFGQAGYGEQMMRWIHGHYAPRWTVGSPPLQDQQFGLQLLVPRTLAE